MQSAPQFAVTIRAIIVDQGQLLMVKHQPGHNYHALPGGRLEIGESLEHGLTRELLEETNVHAQIGRLLFINEWISHTHHRVEFFFWVKNPAAFRAANPHQATHGFEIAELIFGDAANPKLNILPTFLQKKFAQIVELGENYPTEMIRSS